MCDAALDAAYAQAPVRTTVDLGRGAVHLRMWGPRDGTPLLLVHGANAHAGWWDHLAPALADSARVIALDLYGHGDSVWLPEYRWGIWAEQVLRASEQLGARTVIGHSLGGAVGLVAAVRDPAAIELLVMLDTPLPGTRERPRGEVTSSGRNIPSPSVEAARARFRLSPASPMTPHPAIMEHVFMQGLRAVPGGWTWKRDPATAVRHGTQPDVIDLVSAAERTVLVRADHGLLRRDVEAIVHTAGGAGLRVMGVPGAGHHLILDSPAATLSVVRGLI